MIRLACPSCGRNLRVKDELAGKRGVCPYCRQRVNVPASAPTEPFDAATLAPAADLDGEALDFLAPPQKADELGRLGTYRVLNLLGAGGMGLVLLGEDPLLKRAVALKVMRPELAKSRDARQRFLREARAIAAIEHPHIVHVYQVAEDRGVPYLAMPFLKGESLEARLKRECKLPVADSVSIGRQIAEGLAAAHKNDLIHRDIKPGNVWLESHDDPRLPHDWVKLLDFGLARADGEDGRTLTKLGTILGTPGYMAPEQARGEKVDIRCDLFSLGAVLYRMLTGTLPFKGKDTMSLLMSLAADTPRPLREANPDVPPSLDELVMRLLARNAGERPATARAVADALGALEAEPSRSLSFATSPPLTENERAILERPTRLIDPVPVTAAPYSRWRSRWLLRLASMGGLLGLLILIWSLWQTHKTAVINPFVEHDKAITNSIGMKLVRVEPGVFIMGSPVGERERYTDEQEHEVKITYPFYVGAYEVTQEQYERVICSNPSHFSTTGDGRHDTNGLDTRQFPVEEVSWDDAVKFCDRLSSLPAERRHERDYRLPTEAEWEYICRGGPYAQDRSLPTCFGDTLTSKQANFDGNYPYNKLDKGSYLGRPTKVGSYPSNPLGIYDLHGNVSEWCADRYGSEYYKNSPRQDPRGPEQGDLRVLRGGSWYDLGNRCRTAYRAYANPGDPFNSVGFRVMVVSGVKE